MTFVDEGLEILEDEVCRALLATRSVGRLGLSTEGAPMIFPVNYRIVNDAVVFATGPGMKLHAAEMKRYVAFQVDDFDEMACTGWSVLLTGTIYELDHPTRQLCSALDTWAGGDRSHLVRIPIDFISGRRIVREGND